MCMLAAADRLIVSYGFVYRIVHFSVVTAHIRQRRSILPVHAGSLLAQRTPMMPAHGTARIGNGTGLMVSPKSGQEKYKDGKDFQAADHH